MPAPVRGAGAPSGTAEGAFCAHVDGPHVEGGQEETEEASLHRDQWKLTE